MVLSSRFPATFLFVFIACCGSLATDGFCDDTAAFVEPYRDVDLSVSELGTLSHIDVKEGDRVTQGQIVAGLDESVAAAMLTMAKKAKDGRGRLKSAQAELDRAEHNLEMLLQLHARKHATDQEVARAKLDRDVASARKEAVVDELAVKSADFERMKAQLELKRVRSPIDGIVSEVYKDAGEFVSANEPAVVRVVQLDPLVVTFSLPSRYTIDLKPQQAIPLQMGNERRTATGNIEFIAPTIDPQTGTVRVKVLIPNSNLEWQAGERCWFAGSGYEVKSDSHSLTQHVLRPGTNRSTDVQ